MCFSVSLSCTSSTSAILLFPFPFKVWACFPSKIPTNSILFPKTSTILYCTLRQWLWRSERISVLWPACVSLWLSTLLCPQLEDTVSIPDISFCTIIKYSFFNTQKSSHNSTFLLKAWGTMSTECWKLWWHIRRKIRNSFHCITIRQFNIPRFSLSC